MSIIQLIVQKASYIDRTLPFLEVSESGFTISQNMILQGLSPVVFFVQI